MQKKSVVSWLSKCTVHRGFGLKGIKNVNKNKPK